MENITTQLDKITWKPKEKFTQIEKVEMSWDRDPIFLFQEISRESNELNKKATSVINYLKATIIVLILVLVVLVVIVSYLSL